MRWLYVKLAFAVAMIGLNGVVVTGKYGLHAAASLASSLVLMGFAIMQCNQISERKRCDRIRDNWHNQLLRMSAEERAAHVNRFNVFDPREHMDR